MLSLGYYLLSVRIWDVRVTGLFQFLPVFCSCFSALCFLGKTSLLLCGTRPSEDKGENIQRVYYCHLICLYVYKSIFLNTFFVLNSLNFVIPAISDVFQMEGVFSCREERGRTGCCMCRVLKVCSLLKPSPGRRLNAGINTGANGVTALLDKRDRKKHWSQSRTWGDHRPQTDRNTVCNRNDHGKASHRRGIKEFIGGLTFKQKRAPYLKHKLLWKITFLSNFF